MRQAVDSRGFSLIEMMVVISIISVLTTMAVVSYREAKFKVYQNSAKNQLGDLYTLQMIFRNEYGGYTAYLDQLGYDPVGTVYYNVGFRRTPAVTYTTPPPPAGGGCIRTCGGYGSQPPGCLRPQRFNCHYNACAASATELDTEATENTFRAYAHSHYRQTRCNYQDNPPGITIRNDSLYIDQSKRITWREN